MSAGRSEASESSGISTSFPPNAPDMARIALRLSYVAPALDMTRILPEFCDRISKSLSTASSGGTGTCSLPRLTAILRSRRGEFTICGSANLPIGQIALSLFSAAIPAETTFPSFMRSMILQCFGHIEQRDSTVLSGSPNHFPHLSVRQPVGQASMHAPQNRHSSELHDLPKAAKIFAFLPRFAMLMAGLEWIFSQTLKHLPHRTQRLWSLSMKGSSRSTFDGS